AYMEFDMRSVSAEELGKLEKRFTGIIASAVAAENGARSTREGPISANLKVIGDRPAGGTPASSQIVKIAQQAVEAQGLKPELTSSSTDSNLPMSLGIPAITIGSGGSGGRAHSLDEWIDVEKGASLKGMLPGLAMLLAAAELQ
ncbi:MAG TPA: M20/M25/M40 family metallo-hydrolase, partial [Allosphingosinicella sp.]|nr:M20/M25/M40 family metallo-hydrolase [Allosphingosinicella sp.]